MLDPKNNPAKPLGFNVRSSVINRGFIMRSVPLHWLSFVSHHFGVELGSLPPSGSVHSGGFPPGVLKQAARNSPIKHACGRSEQ